MAVIDTLTAKPRNLLKKTGDAMISGFLTLFQDPVEDMHAVTKRYVDGLVAGSAAIHVPRTASMYYGATFIPEEAAGYTTEYINSGLDSVTRMSPLFCGGSRAWDRIGMFVRHASAPGSFSFFRWVIYALDATTLFPTSILYQSPGDFSTTTTTPTWHEETISLTTTDDWIGVGWHWRQDQGETNAVRCYVASATSDAARGYCPYGLSRSGDVLTATMTLIAHQADNISTPAAAGLFAVENTTEARADSGVFLRRV